MRRTPLRDYARLRHRFDKLSGIAETDDLEQAVERMHCFVRSVGYSYSGFAVVRASATSEVADVRTEFAEPLLARATKEYTDLGLHSGDPVAHGMARGQSFLVASDVLQSDATRLPNDTRDGVSALYARYDIEDHATMLVPSPVSGTLAVFGFGQCGQDKADDFAGRATEDAPYMRMAALLVLDKALRGNARPIQRLLTPAQAEILEGLAGGLTPSELAHRDGRSLHTVRSHIRAATQRLGAKTTVEAVSVALHLGEISSEHN